MGFLSDLSDLLIPKMGVTIKRLHPKCYELWSKNYDDDGNQKPESENPAENDFDMMIESALWSFQENGINDHTVETYFDTEEETLEHRGWSLYGTMVKVRFHDIARIAAWDNTFGITVFCRNGVVFGKEMPNPKACQQAF